MLPQYCRRHPGFWISRKPQGNPILTYFNVSNMSMVLSLLGWLEFILPLAYWLSINNHEDKYTNTDRRSKHSRPNTRIFCYLLGRISHHFFFSNLHDIPFQHILWFIVPLSFLSLVQSELFSWLIKKREKRNNI